MRLCRKMTLLLGGTLLAITLLTTGAWSEPLAPMPEMTEEGRQMLQSQGKTLADVEKKIPSRAEVGVPVYPGARYATHVEPAREGMLPSVSLISDDPPDQVKEWYGRNLPGYAHNEMFDLFYQGPPGQDLSFKELTSTPTVTVTEEDGESLDLMFSRVPHVKTRVIISYRPK
ncbi:MAG: hypothetical protein R6U29_03230 [Desulfosudaceae bacterium]